MDSLDYVDDNNNDETVGQFKSKINLFKTQLDQRIDLAEVKRQKINDKYERMLYEIRDHFQQIIENVIKNKQLELENQLKQDFDTLVSEYEDAISEVKSKKEIIENELKTFDIKLNKHLNEQQLAINSQCIYNENDENDDALMISEANEEIPDSIHHNTNVNNSNNTTNPNGAGFVKTTNNATNSIDNYIELTNLKQILNDQLAIDYIDAKIQKFIDCKIAQCKPDIAELCCGHVSKPQCLDHTHFALEQSSSDNGNLFVKSQRCAIKLSCPGEYDRDVNIHDLLKIVILDPKRQSVPFDLRERFSNAKRYIKLTFTPELSGYHKLTVTYNNSYIQNSPFFFNVIKESLEASKRPDGLQTSASQMLMKSEPIEVFHSSSLTTSSSTATAAAASNVITLDDASDGNIHRSNEILNNNNPPRTTFGRGRLIKQLINEHANNRSNRPSLSNFNFAGQPSSSPSNIINLTENSNSNSLDGLNKTQRFSTIQKRKSPQAIDSNDQHDNDIEMCEISTKLKKVVVDETNNQYFQYTMQSPNISDHRLFTAHSYLDQHLRKHANTKFGEIPPLKAKFQRKFDYSMNYPIGVYACNVHNWLLVADSGNGAIKIFEKTTGELIHELASGFNFKRPSALLVNSTGTELFVKDDKEIQVFDLENSFKLKRKFGTNMFRRPYGLSFTEREDIVLIDADFRKPLIYTYDKNGQLLNSKTYQPVVKEISSKLSYPNLSKTIGPFDKTKVRFIHYYNNCLYASDLGRSIVYKTTLDGEILFAFGHHGKHKGEFNEPSGIHVDTNGTILIGDSKNDRLQVYDNQGKYRCDIEFVDERIRRPSDIHVDKDGYLYVTCFLEHVVKKYKFVE